MLGSMAWTREWRPPRRWPERDELRAFRGEDVSGSGDRERRRGASTSSSRRLIRRGENGRREDHVGDRPGADMRLLGKNARCMRMSTKLAAECVWLDFRVPRDYRIVLRPRPIVT